MIKLAYVGIVVSLLIACGLLSTKNRILSDQLKEETPRRMRLAENSYNLGCYNFSKTYCPSIENDFERNDCYTMASDQCEIQGKQYIEWLQSLKGEIK